VPGGADAAVLHLRRHRVPGPQQRAAARIEGAHHACGHVGAHVFRDATADDDAVTHDGRWHGHAVVAGERVTEAGLQVDRAVAAEVAARLAVAGIERDEARILGAGEDAAGAGAAGGGAHILVVTDAAAYQEHRPGAVEFGIERPQLVAALRIERYHAVGARAQVQPPLGEDRRGFQRRQTPHLRRQAAGEHAAHLGAVGRVRRHEARFPDAVRPGDLQAADVGGRDLCDGGVAQSAGISPPRGPRADGARVVERRAACAAREQRQHNYNNPARAARPLRR
jgi:hypothetical protein